MLSPEERRAKTIQNLTAIAAALESYTQNSNSVPEPAFTDEATRAPLLSWRVAILPQLGYAKLYSQFKLDQRWDSPHNRQLLKEIPQEFQSPERFDEKTNYLCPVGAAVAMSPNSNRPFTQFKDGMANTILLIEVDDAGAVPWTQPADWTVKLNEPAAGLGTLREGGFLAVLASARVVKVPQATPADQIRALFTFAGGEGLKAVDVVKEPAADPKLEPATVALNPPVKTAPAIAANANLETATSSPNAAPPAGEHHVDVAALTALLAPSAALRVGLSPVPSDAECKVAKDLLRQIYAKDYAAAQKPEEKQQLARQLISDASTVQENRAEQYELLRIARDIGVQLGDVTLALQATQALEAAFALEGMALRVKTLADLQAAAGKNGPWDAALLTEARKAAFEAQQQGRFDAAGTAIDVFLAAARATGDGQLIQQATAWREQLDTAKQAYAEVPAALSTLAQQPADAAACEIVGRYLCLVRHRWDLGLPLLARSENIKFRFVATIDLDAGKTPKALVQLGDAYWQLAEEFKGPLKASLLARGAHCYSQALPQLPGGLERIKVQKRVNELTAALGQEQIQRYAGEKPAATLPTAAPHSATVGRPDPNAQFE
jgi:hypothetical protein